jgi:antitoxin (DNA-binding transcriptional repressor) of toxin-antitoxin stability system
MITVSVHEAKTPLSRLINDVLAGKEVIVSRGKHGVVKIVPVVPVVKAKRVGGWLAHTLSSSNKDPLEDGFWDPLSDEELALWKGENQEKWAKSAPRHPCANLVGI